MPVDKHDGVGGSYEIRDEGRVLVARTDEPVAEKSQPKVQPNLKPAKATEAKNKDTKPNAGGNQ